MVSNCEIWRQTEFSLYAGQTTESEIVYTKNILEYFDVNYDEEEKKDYLVASSIPAGFACLIQCKKN
jgi:hypothetical protein